MIRPGSTAKVKVDGEKYRGIVTDVAINTQSIEVTKGPKSGDPDHFRKFAPGRTFVTVTIELEGPWE